MSSKKSKKKKSSSRHSKSKSKSAAAVGDEVNQVQELDQVADQVAATGTPSSESVTDTDIVVSAAETAKQVLTNETRADVRMFDAMVDMIPVTYYYPDEVHIPTVETKSQKKRRRTKVNKLEKKKKDKRLQRLIDELEPEADTAPEVINLFNPDEIRTVSNMQRKITANVTAMIRNENKPKSRKLKKQLLQKQQQQKQQHKQQQKGNDNIVLASNAKKKKGAANQISELRIKLHQKIKSLQQNRHTVNNPMGQSKRAAAASGERPNKRKRMAEQEQYESSDDGADDTVRASHPKRSKHDPDQHDDADAADGISDDFMFSVTKAPPKKSDKPANLYHTLVHRKKDSNKKLLKKAMAFERNVQTLDKAEQEKVRTKRALQSALLKAQGVNVKDDAALLKKAMKREERNKLKSQRDWNKRKKAVTSGIAARQDKRESNIQARKQANLDRKKQRRLKKMMS
jgi:Surfeit locus protein 6/60S ribosome biogenesis protein Rrp14